MSSTRRLLSFVSTTRTPDDRASTPSRDLLSLAAYCGDHTAFDALGDRARETLLTHEWREYDRPDDDASDDAWLPFEHVNLGIQRLAARSAVREAFYDETEAEDELDHYLSLVVDLRDEDLLDLRRLDEDMDTLLNVIAWSNAVFPSMDHGRASVVALARAFLDSRGELEPIFQAAALEVGLVRALAVTRHDLLASGVALPEKTRAYLGDAAARRTSRPGSGCRRWVRGLARWGHAPILTALDEARRQVETAARREGRPDSAIASFVRRHEVFVAATSARPLPDVRGAVDLVTGALDHLPGPFEHATLLGDMKTALHRSLP